MRTTFIHLLAFLFLAALGTILSGCESLTNGQPVAAKLDEQFTLKIGQRAVVQDNDLADTFTLTFLNVTQDSRCPSDFMCVWAGQVIVLMHAIQGDTNLGDFNLTLSPGGGLARKQFEGYSLELVSVSPYPKSTQRIRPEQYAATFVLERLISTTRAASGESGAGDGGFEPFTVPLG